MDRTSVSLELRLIGQRISKRIRLGRELAGSAWTPKAMDLPPGQRMLVISPHPDDDAIGCGGTIIKAVQRGRSVRVVYLSLSESGVTGRGERRKEALEALRRMGVEDYLLPEAEFPASRGRLQELIGEGMKDWSPDCVLVPSPLENHDQHLATFEAYLELLRGGPGLRTVLYEVWGMLVPNLVVDVTEQAPMKAEAIAAHASQVRMVDYVSMASALNRYRAISTNLEGQAEAFLCLERDQMLELFG